MERVNFIGKFILVVCCVVGGVSSSITSNSDTGMVSVNDPFAQQCTWLFKANPEDCRSYFQCLHGRQVLRRCPRTLNWNAEGHYCDHQARSVCKAGKRKGGSSSMSTSSVNSVSSVDNSVLEVYDHTRIHLMKGKWRDPCPDNSFKPYPGDCTKFIHCLSNNQYSVKECPAGLLWDPKINVCNWASQVNCNSSSSSGIAIQETTTTTTTSTTTEAPSSSPTLPPFFPPTTPPPQPIITSTEVTTTTTTPWTTTTTRPTTTTQSSQTIYPILIPTSEQEPEPENQVEYKVVCYFTNWAVYRQEGGKYTPADVDPTKCTHIIYAFACLNPLTFKLEMCDPWIDGPEGKNFYGQLTAFRKLGVKVMAAVGGWNDSAYSKWTLMLKDLQKMETFINSICEFLTKYEFDGLDIDYEYPGCPQANCNFDSRFEKQGFVALVSGIKQRCGPRTLLSAAVSCNENIIKEAYDVPTLSKHLDFINMMAYDFHGAWESETGVNAPFEASANDKPHLNVRHAVEVYLSLGAPANKLIVGMPMYGQSFTVTDTFGGSEVGVKTSGPGRAGPCTKQKGMMAYYEICNSTWTKVVEDKDNKIGPIRYDIIDGTWISHDNPRHIRHKCNFIKRQKLGGAMIWSLDLDDFHDVCGEGKYPLLSAIHEQLIGSFVAPPPPVTTLKKTVKSNGKVISTSNTNGKNKRSSSSSSNTNRVNNSRSNGASSKRQRKSSRRN